MCTICIHARKMSAGYHNHGNVESKLKETGCRRSVRSFVDIITRSEG
jgi:hypothetical protein